MSIGFTTTRALIPETDEVEIRVTYAADMTARVSVESLISGGYDHLNEIIDNLRDQLTYDILKDLE